MIEHTVLFLQYYVQGLSKPSGILEGLFNDTIVQVHLVFNLILFILLLACFEVFFRIRSANPDLLHGPNIRIRGLKYALYGLTGFQAIHMFDHSVQYFQYYVLGMSHPTGLFGAFINESNIGIHIVVNGIILAGLITTTYYYSIFRASVTEESGKMSIPIAAS